ncbi:nuclear transcription factor Y subunit B-9-like [Gastrolobium bilobum]|uniref:nuclear transcription factor Y subunit B-9-like n=1 Tax=Gastrolobium bilobum TaxID=150636 RepID=UPI002AB1E2E9|nr:nuclear transcription factor Y subunit B-9-like [Gastrolobium bilobum]
MAGLREQDQYMPIANVIRIMRRILPSHAKISDDAKETIQECVSEYISFITSEANERCQREQRKTVTADDLLWAMGKLGFDDYVHPLILYLHRYRDIEGEPSSLRRSSTLTMPYSPPPPPTPTPQPQPPGSCYGYAMFDPNLVGFYRDDVASASATFINSFDPYAHIKRDPQ